MNELDQELDALLARVRRDRLPSDARKVAVRERLFAQVALLQAELPNVDIVSPAPPPAAPPVPPPLPNRLPLPSALPAAGAPPAAPLAVVPWLKGMLVVVGAVLFVRAAEPVAVNSPPKLVPAAKPTPELVVRPSPTMVPLPEVHSLAEDRTQIEAPSERQGRAHRSRSREGSDLGVQADMLAKALRAIQAGSLAAAERLLHQHVDRFPDSPLAPERAKAFSRLERAREARRSETVPAAE